MLFIYLHLDNKKKSSSFQGDAHNITVESCQAYPPRVLINESIIWEMNPLVVAATSKFNSILHFWMRNEQWISFDWTSLYSARSTKIFEWKKIDLKRFSPDKIQECLAGRNFMASSSVNSLLITHAGMQIWIWNQLLPTDSSFEP